MKRKEEENERLISNLAKEKSKAVVMKEKVKGLNGEVQRLLGAFRHIFIDLTT